jgi:hypothetical protein
MATRLNRLTPAISALMASEPPFIAMLQTCAAGLRAGTVRPGDPSSDSCLRPPPAPPEYPPELQAALDKAHAGASPEAIATALENIAFYNSPKLLEQDSKIASNPRRTYGARPLIVLSAGMSGSTPDLPAAIQAELPIQMREKQRVHERLAALSMRGVHRIVRDSAHDIPHIEPAAVIDAIDDVVDQVRTR